MKLPLSSIKNFFDIALFMFLFRNSEVFKINIHSLKLRSSTFIICCVVNEAQTYNKVLTRKT